MRLVPWLCAMLVVGGVASQEPKRHFSMDRSFSVILPDGWRQLTPDEARTLSRRADKPIPGDVVGPRPAAYYPYGEVDGWLEDGFDGRCLTVVKVDGEPSMDDEGLASVRGQAKDAAGGWTRKVLEASVVELGAANHKVIQCTSRLVPGTGARPCLALELFIPTAGDTLILGFRAHEPDFATALPGFREVAATLSVARAARGPSKLGDRLLYPAIIGALVGLLLLVLRKKAIPGA